VASRLLNGIPHVVVAVKIEDISDEVKCVLVILHVGVETGEVESIGQVLFVDLAKVLVATRGDELARHRC
jgi:hypothetical protein